MIPIQYRREARDDLNGIHGWYERRRRGLGDEFLETVAMAVARAQRQPLRFMVARGQVRRLLMVRFPYVIYFLPTAARLYIVAVAHERQDQQPFLDRS